MTTPSVASVVSPNTHGDATEHGTVVVSTTSDESVDAVPPVPSESTTSMAGERLDRTTSPHEALAIAAAATTAARRTLRINIGFVLMAP
jgi:hypothetical protein